MPYGKFYSDAYQNLSSILQMSIFTQNARFQKVLSLITNLVLVDEGREDPNIT